MSAGRSPSVVLAPDSFKGSLDAPAVCAALERAALSDDAALRRTALRALGRAEG